MDDLTDEEKKRLSRLLRLEPSVVDRLEKVAEDDARMEWLWSAIRRVASTVAIVVGAIVLFYDNLKSIIKSIAGQ